MAEALGVAAAAIQIADTAVKLRKLWLTLKDMPATVHDAVEEVSLLAETLARIQNVPLPGLTMRGNTTAWDDCHRTLEAVSVSFRSLVNDLEDHITKHKKRGSIRALLRRDEITEYRDRLERLKTTMILARQAYSQMLLTQQNSEIINMLQAIGKGRLAGCPNLTPADDALPVTRVDNVVPLIRATTTPDRSRRPQRSSRLAHLKLPEWICRRSLEVLLTRSYGAWCLNLRVYNKVSRHAPVFDAARRGDWPRVQELFNEGKASPFDYCDSRYSLLHIATECADAIGCRFLLNHGLDPRHQFDGDLNPLEELGAYLLRRTDWSWFDRSSANVMEVVRDLAPSIECHTERPGFSFYEFPAEIVSILIKSLPFSYDTIEPLRRARALALHRSGDVGSVSLILGSDLTLREAFILLKNDVPTDAYDVRTHRDVLTNITLRLALTTCMYNDAEIQLLAHDWQTVVNEIIAFERQNEKLLPFFSPLQLFLWKCCEYGSVILNRYEHGTSMSRKLTSACRIWIGFLVSMGVSLNNYARAERDFFRATKRLPVFDMFQDFYAISLSGLLCGPSVDDWFVYAIIDSEFDHDYDEEYAMAGDFWQWIENPELFFVPGTYLDESSFQAEFSGTDPFEYVTAGPVF